MPISLKQGSFITSFFLPLPMTRTSNSKLSFFVQTQSLCCYYYCVCMYVYATKLVAARTKIWRSSLSLFFLDSLSLTLTIIYILSEPEPPLRNHPRPRPRPRPLFYLFAPFPSLPFNFLYLSPYFSIQKYPTFIYWHFLQKPVFTTTQPTNKTMDVSSSPYHQWLSSFLIIIWF